MTTHSTIRKVVNALTVSLFMTCLATAWSSPVLAGFKKFGDFRSIKGVSTDNAIGSRPAGAGPR